MKITRNLLHYLFAGLVASLFVQWPQLYAQSEEIHSFEKRATTSAASEQRISREYLIKAAIIYNLAKFTTWPNIAFAGANAPVRLCIIGDDPFGAALESIEAKPVGDRRLNSALISELEYASACHILFISASEVDRLIEIFDVIKGQPLLTVADMQDFAHLGGIVGLTRVDDRVGLRVNVVAAKQAGLRFSSKLLRLAEIVDPAVAQPSGGAEK